MIKKFYIQLQIDVPEHLLSELPDDKEIISSIKDIFLDELGEELKPNITVTTKN